MISESTTRPSLLDLYGGKAIIVRTVTYHYTGRLVGLTTRGDLVLQDAAWIADSGRWAQALETGRLGEVEPYPAGPVVIAVGAVVDVAEWRHDLPRETR